MSAPSVATKTEWHVVGEDGVSYDYTGKDAAWGDFDSSGPPS